MILTDEKAKQFYSLWIPLLDYVNRKYRIVEELYGMSSPEGLPIKKIALISAKLWDNKGIIDEFLESGVKTLSEEEAVIVSDWKKAVSGTFIVDRHLKNGSVLVSIETKEVYIVKGIYSTWREILQGFPMPQIVKATLIPFENEIIHDGVISPYGVYIGKSMSEQSKQIYLRAKESGNLHFCL